MSKSFCKSIHDTLVWAFSRKNNLFQLKEKNNGTAALKIERAPARVRALFRECGYVMERRPYCVTQNAMENYVKLDMINHIFAIQLLYISYHKTI